jgi:hypothetical protein
MVKVNPLEVPPPGVGFTTVTVAVPAVAMSLVGTEAFNCVPLTYFVVSPVPFHWTTEVERKFVPVTVRVKAAPPAVALEGDSEVAPGFGLLMVKVNPLEVPPPGVGFTTVTVAVPAVAMSLAGTEAFNCVPLTYLVVSPVAFHWTVELETKFVPVTVRVKAAPPAVALEGESEVAPGFGLLMVKVKPPDVPPPGVGFTTVTVAVPAVAMSLAGTEAFNCVPLTYFVVSPVPFHWTTEAERKFVPFTVRVKAAPPAVALEGEREVAVGAGLPMVKVSAFEVPPPGEGLTTVTEAVPPVAMSLADTAVANCVLLT